MVSQVYTLARYAGENKSDEANIEKLLNKLGNTTDRRAQFVCVISMSGPDGKQKYLKVLFQVKLQMENMAKMVSGYDPIFDVPKLDKTMAQLSKEQKGQISHRRNAINLLQAFLEGDKRLNGLL
ncbi:non-canonical purine NTP pyrophosphatase [Staphylococcus aureus]